jgi:hypothetical protein
MIQCARIAFGFVGVFDPDEAERIAESAFDEQPLGLIPPAMPTPKIESENIEPTKEE